MKHLSTMAISALSLTLFANFSSGDSVAGDDKKPKINFYGSLTNRDGQTFNVENITISHLYKQISVYQKPSQVETVKDEHIISVDPKLEITKIDLNEISTIEVPSPEVLYTYQKKPLVRKQEYVEITVTSKDTKKTKHTYLIEARKKVFLDEQNETNPIEKEISFQAIKSLTIDGYKQSDETKNKTNGSPIVCAPASSLAKATAETSVPTAG